MSPIWPTCDHSLLYGARQSEPMIYRWSSKAYDNLHLLLAHQGAAGGNVSYGTESLSLRM